MITRRDPQLRPAHLALHGVDGRVTSADARAMPHLAELWPSEASRAIPWLTAGAIGPLALGLPLASPLALQARAVVLAAV